MDGSRRIAFSGDQSVIREDQLAPDARHRKVELDPVAGNRCAYEQIQYRGYRRKGTDGFTQSQRIVRGNHLVIQIVFSLVGVKNAGLTGV